MPGLNGLQHLRGQCIRIHLEADRERRGGRDVLHDLVQAQRVGPERLVAERLETEDLLALVTTGPDGAVGSESWLQEIAMSTLAATPSSGSHRIPRTDIADIFAMFSSLPRVGCVPHASSHRVSYRTISLPSMVGCNSQK